MSGFRLYFRYVGVAMRSQLQYPASFVLHSLGSMLFTMTHLISLVMLFQRFDTLGQWTLGEAMLFYGMAYMASALAKIYMRGLMMVGSMVQSGEFDRILLRPRSALLQTMGADLQFMRVGEFLDGLIPFAIGVIMVRPGWGAAQWLLIIAAVTLGSLTYAGIALIRAMVSFFTVESLEVFNIFIYGGVEANSKPMDIYVGWFRDFFIYVIPLAAINYLPMSVLLGMDYVSGWAAYLSPLMGLGFFMLGIMFWRFGVRHYRSTGS